MAGNQFHTTLVNAAIFLLILFTKTTVAEQPGQSEVGSRELKSGSISQLSGNATTKGKLDSGQTQVYELNAAEGDYVQGQLAGPQLSLALLNRENQQVRMLARGEAMRQDFRFIVENKGPYKLEVSAAEPASFSIQLKAFIPRNEQFPPPDVLQSPRLRELEETVSTSGSTEQFWQEMQKQGTPLIETANVIPPLSKGTALVTFLWRGASRNVRLFGAPSGDHDELRRLKNSDVWFGSYRVPLSSRIGYKLAPDVPEFKGTFWERRRAILATAQHDPFNKKYFPEDAVDQYDGESFVELPGASKQPWIIKNNDTPAGKVETHRFSSKILGNIRDLFVYRPHDYQAASKQKCLLLVFDGEKYLNDIKLPVILDNLIAMRMIPPTAVVFISNPSGESRSLELPCNPDLARFLAEELFPWIRQQKLDATREKTVIAGASYGGLAAAYAGLKHPELFGNVYCQSGSFWWSPRSTPEMSEVEPEWLTRQFVTAPVEDVHFYLEAGQFESNPRGGGSILGTTRHLRDVLQAKGYPVQLHEYASGHGYFYWRYNVPDALIRLLGTQHTTTD